MLLSTIQRITAGEWLQQGEDQQVADLVYDTRKISLPLTSLFFAIKGARHDGHQHIAAAYQAGIRMFVLTERLDVSAFPQASFVLVKNSVVAMQQIAAEKRKQYQIPVIAVTGSNGKTIVKEWLSQLLSKDHVVVKSPKSYNSQIGVPVSVWQMSEGHTIGVFEAGISQPGEMEKLEKIIQPTIGILTNIGSAHDEGFSSREQKGAEKIRLFEHCERIIYCSDQELPDHLLKHNDGALSWSRSKAANVELLNYEQRSRNTDLFIRYNGTEFTVDVPFTDDASLENVMHCITYILYLNYEVEELQSRLRALQPVAMRLEMKEGMNNSYLIDDTYNHDLAGLTPALDFLASQKQRKKKTAILSDMLEHGMKEEDLYERIARLLSTRRVDKIIGIGKNISAHASHFPPGSKFYPDTETFLQQLDANEFKDEMVLVKGARVYGFERIIRSLQSRVHGTVMEINLDALAHNLNYYRNKLTPGTKIMVMVKALAYGSGSFEVANLLQFHRVDYLAVAYADEGVALRENGISLPVMVMNPSWHTFEKLVQNNLEPELYSIKILNDFLEYLQMNEAKSSIHLKIDTGMHRLGFEEKDLSELIKILKSAGDRIKVASIFTHLAGADEEKHNAFTLQQLDQLEKAADQLDQALGYHPYRHALNSAGIVRFPERQMDMVRLGIGLYGVEANGLDQQSLQVVGTLKTIISQIKTIQPDETVGYGRWGKVEKPSRVATIAIGYADGYSRKFSRGVGYVLIDGKRCPVIGNVCMDMCMVDISATEAKEGDEVIVFGAAPSVVELASAAGTIPYELLTGISERVKRVFYTE